MALANISPTKEGFEQCEWQEVIASAETKDCGAYLRLLGEKAQQEEAAGNTKAQQVFELLYHVCSLTLKLDSPSEPFGPLLVIADTHSAAIDDFTEEHLDTLQAIVSDGRRSGIEGKNCGYSMVQEKTRPRDGGACDQVLFGSR